MDGRQVGTGVKVGVIYMLKSPGGHLYIGQTKNFESRMERYKKLDCKSQTLLYKALKRYGYDNFTVSILCRCPIEDLDKKEIEMINRYKSCFRDNQTFGLNILKESYEEYKKIYRTIPSHKPKRKVRRITQSTVFGDFIRVWDSAYRAAKDLNLKRKEILKAARSKSKYYAQYNWSYEKVVRDS